MQWTEIAGAGEAQRPDGDAPPLVDRRLHRPARPSADHPWRRDIEGYRTASRGGQTGRAAAMNSLWKLPQPWTPRHAPTAAWKTTERFSTSSHRRIAHQRGHFYFVKNGDISISL